jgi:hypothetical protein
VQPTDYDTSWAARLREEDGRPAYPHLLGWLISRQHPDGSWGSRVPHAHDRVLSTLAMVVLLAREGNPDGDGPRSKGEAYLKDRAGHLGRDAHRTIGFELILPSLLAEAEELGLDLPYAALQGYERDRARKLALLPMHELFQTHTTALFSLEAFREDLDVEGAVDLLSESGSMVDSPSATAYLLGRTPNWRARLPRSAKYLDRLLAGPGAGLPPVHPCDVFVRAWILYYLQHGGLFEEHADLLRPHLEHLLGALGPDGLGFSATSGFVDSDDTAVALMVLGRAGYEVDGSPLLRFERDGWFAVHGYESNPSVSANLHVLEALEFIPEEHRPRVREKILGYLMGERRGCAYWHDKWHASAYYPTTRALAVLSAYLPEEVEATLNWLLATQREDGSWGQYCPTTEETSLVLLALLAHHRNRRRLPREPLRAAARRLAEAERPPERGYPELWMGKTLYAPAFAIQASRISALALYEDTFGSPG